MIPADDFYESHAGALKQGDILLAGVTRLVAEDRFTPPAWEQLDAHDVTIAVSDERDLRLEAGPALVMITSHDCHFDKDWNRERNRLIRAGIDEEDASYQAESDATLDRTFTASPLVYPQDVGRDEQALLAGRILGYLPVPESDDGRVPLSVVDLTYRVTLDRMDVVPIVRITEHARSRLRYTLARLDSLRSTTVGFKLEDVIGRSINDVTFPTRQPLLVRLHLDDGTSIDLLQHPGEPNDDAPSRSGLRS